MTNGAAAIRATVSWSARPISRGEYVADDALLESARCQPRRDRDPDLPNVARARDRLHRRLFGGRSIVAPRTGRGRSLAARPRGPERELLEPCTPAGGRR